MIPQKIQALFYFIDYLDNNRKTYIEQYIPLCNEITSLDIERRQLKPNENYVDKQRYGNIQSQIEEKLAPIKLNIYEPILNKLRELEIWSGDNVYASIWNGNISAISDFKSNFTSDDIVQVVDYKKKYLIFRKETNTDFLCLPFVLQNLDEIFKVLFDFFKDTDENEFDSFDTKKTIEVNSIEEAVKSLQKSQGKSVKFSIPSDTFFKSPNEKNVLANLINFKNEIIMGDKFENIYHSTIYNRSTFTEAFNAIKTNYNEDTAQALEVIKLLVEKSGNIQAGELFDSFNEEVKKDKPKKSVLASLWDGLIKIVPMITQTVGLADKIIPLIQR